MRGKEDTKMIRKIFYMALVFLFFLSPSIASSEELNPLAKGFGWAYEKIEGLKEGWERVKIRNIAKDELRDQGISIPTITNKEFDTTLQKEYQGITYSEWFAISKKSDNAYASLQKREYFETAKTLFDVVKAGVSLATGEIPIVFIATAPIKYALENAFKTVEKGGFESQMRAYFKVRDEGITHEEILRSSKSEVQNVTENATFSVDGYFSSIDGKRIFGPRPMKEKDLMPAEEFFNMADYFYKIGKEKEQYETKKKEIANSFAKELQVLSKEEEKRLGKVGQHKEIQKEQNTNDTQQYNLNVAKNMQNTIAINEKPPTTPQPITAPVMQVVKPPSDASQLSQRNAQQQLTPVKVEFRQEYDLLFTQSADSLGSRYGSHSGTIDGTRFDISGDSRAGDFTGSFSGRTVAEPGYTPVTHNNTPSSGTSVGTVSAKGFKEGDLKGNMTITIPAGTQAVNVSGNITISKDGSLSMPSYTGPVTDNATSTKVGTMSGTWNQSKTTP